MAFPTYDALDSSTSEIRLLKLHLSEDGNIDCELTKHSLDENPKYHALSYVWGDPAITRDILVDGKIFAATTNLAAALESMSAEISHSTWLWVDAICINQADIEERSSQVHLMRPIFKKACMVWAWLGPEDDNSTEVIEMIKYLASEIRASANADVEILSRPVSSQLLQTPNLNEDRCLFPKLMSMLGDIISLLQDRPFWNRAWILQEMVLAEIVVFICGRAAFTMQDVSDILSWLQSLPSAAKPDAAEDREEWVFFRTILKSSLEAPMGTASLVSRSATIVSSVDSYMQAWRVLQHAWPLMATDPRDKIYSLLGLMNISLEADYSKSSETIYQEVAATILPQIPLDEWFARAGIGFGDRINALPTWIVDWNSVPATILRYSAFCRAGWTPVANGALYHADARMNDLSQQIQIRPQILTISGAIFDEIEFTAPFTYDEPSNARDAFEFDLTGGLPNEEALNTLVPPGIPRGQASLRLFFEDKDLAKGCRYSVTSSFYSQAASYIISMSSGDEWLAKHLHDVDSFTQLFLGHSITPELLAGVGLDEPVTDLSEDLEFRSQMFIHFNTARHFYTRKGYLGCGAPGLKKGDLVCVLPRCRAPVILRRDGEVYQLVSTGLVLGIIDGEVAEMVEKGELSMQQFNIR